MISIIDFKPEHIDQIDYKEFYGDRKRLKENTLKNCEGEAILTLVDSKSGEIVCIMGLVKMWPGVAECWSIMSKNVSNHRFSLLGTVLRTIDTYMEGYGIRRLQASCPSSIPEGPRWFKALRFNFEGCMQAYGIDGSNYDMYARVK